MRIVYCETRLRYHRPGETAHDHHSYSGLISWSPVCSSAQHGLHWSWLVVTGIKSNYWCKPRSGVCHTWSTILSQMSPLTPGQHDSTGAGTWHIQNTHWHIRVFSLEGGWDLDLRPGPESWDLRPETWDLMMMMLCHHSWSLSTLSRMLLKIWSDDIHCFLVDW